MDELKNIKWLGHASFFFVDENGNNIYYVDPFDLRGRVKDKADLVFITHTHYDHFSPEDLSEILTDQTIIIAPSDILAKIDQKVLPAGRQVEVEPNKDYETKGFKFSTIPAYNTHPERLKFHPKENNWVGYIFELNGKKIYHAGDTDLTPEMAGLTAERLDIALLPMGGRFTMDVQEAIGAANAIGAQITIPMHYKLILGDDYKAAEEKFKEGVVNSKVVILEELK